MTKLTSAQQAALARCTAEWQSAYDLQASIATLDALVKRGILERRMDALGSMFSPRTANHYRLAVEVEPDVDTDFAQCEYCGTKENLAWGPDPYALEINDNDTEMWLCQNCLHELSNDI